MISRLKIIFLTLLSIGLVGWTIGYDSIVMHLGERISTNIMYTIHNQTSSCDQNKNKLEEVIQRLNIVHQLILHQQKQTQNELILNILSYIHDQLLIHQQTLVCTQDQSNHQANEQNIQPNNKPAKQETISASYQELLDIVNKEREVYRLPTLQWDKSLAIIAQHHAQDMHDHNYLSHTSLDGRSPFQRLTQAGYTYRVAAENIAQGQHSNQEVMKDWMNSPGHRANILNKDITHIGLGRSGNYRVQLFAKPR